MRFRLSDELDKRFDYLASFLEKGVPGRESIWTGTPQSP